MRTSAILAFGLSALVASVSAAITPARSVLMSRDYPACANNCISNANLHGCNVVDFTCLCTNHAFLDDSSQCIYNACTNPADLKQAIQTANEACEAAGITITSTYTPTQSRSQTAGGTSTSASVSASTTGTTTTGAPSSTGSSTTASAPASTTSTGAAAARFATSSNALVVVGAAVLGALAF